jgi:hypothetical protein
MPPVCGITRKIMNDNFNISHKAPAQPALLPSCIHNSLGGHDTIIASVTPRARRNG